MVILILLLLRLASEARTKVMQPEVTLVLTGLYKLLVILTVAPSLQLTQPMKPPKLLALPVAVSVPSKTQPSIIV